MLSQPKQPMLNPKEIFLRAACLLLAGSVIFPQCLGHGRLFISFGAVNSSLGGAATAGNSDDLIGSIYKNPASGILFADRTASIVFGDIIPSARVDSSVGALGLNGTSNSTVNGVPYLSLMTSWKSSDPGLAWFAGAVSEAGLSFHAATSTTNPIFFPQAGSNTNPYGEGFRWFWRRALEPLRDPLANRPFRVSPRRMVMGHCPRALDRTQPVHAGRLRGAEPWRERPSPVCNGSAGGHPPRFRRSGWVALAGGEGSFLRLVALLSHLVPDLFLDRDRWVGQSAHDQL